jgi:hypothetical protein
LSSRGHPFRRVISGLPPIRTLIQGAVVPAADPTLIAVVEPVDPALFAAWIAHYRSLGVDRFQLGFRFPAHVSSERHRELQAACCTLGIVPAAICSGTWDESVGSELRDALREKAGSGWHLLAGVQEFHHFPVPLPEVITRAEWAGVPAVGGVLLDRVAADGRLAGIDRVGGLDRTFPLGGHLTHRLLDGDPCRIVLARSDVRVDRGSHRVLGHEPYPGVVAAVHHFAWHADAMDQLRRSVAASGIGSARGLAADDKTHVLLGFAAEFSGRIDVADVRLRFRHVSLAEMPRGWHHEVRRMAAGWRARAGQGGSR